MNDQTIDNDNPNDDANVKLLVLIDTIPELTNSEKGVVYYVFGGLTNKQIAKRLIISEHTVERHVSDILSKLNLANRTAAARYVALKAMVPDDKVVEHLQKVNWHPRWLHS
jgi:DNA-binding NarL/FixJ family response regulator